MTEAGIGPLPLQSDELFQTSFTPLSHLSLPTSHHLVAPCPLPPPAPHTHYTHTTHHTPPTPTTAPPTCQPFHLPPPHTHTPRTHHHTPHPTTHALPPAGIHLTRWPPARPTSATTCPRHPTAAPTTASPSLLHHAPVVQQDITFFRSPLRLPLCRTAACIRALAPPASYRACYLTTARTALHTPRPRASAFPVPSGLRAYARLYTPVALHIPVDGSASATCTDGLSATYLASTALPATPRRSFLLLTCHYLPTHTCLPHCT